MIAEGKLETDNLAIYYVDFDKEKVESTLKRITVNSEGEVDFWPSKIFNESLEEVLAIRKAQNRITK